MRPFLTRDSQLSLSFGTMYQVVKYKAHLLNLALVTTRHLYPRSMKPQNFTARKLVPLNDF